MARKLDRPETWKLHSIDVGFATFEMFLYMYKRKVYNKLMFSFLLIMQFKQTIFELDLFLGNFLRSLYRFAWWLRKNRSKVVFNRNAIIFGDLKGFSCAARERNAPYSRTHFIRRHERVRGIAEEIFRREARRMRDNRLVVKKKEEAPRTLKWRW